MKVKIYESFRATLCSVSDQLVRQIVRHMFKSLFLKNIAQNQLK